MARTLDDVARLLAPETGLATLALTRPDGSVQATLVNAGTLTHPVTGDRIAGLLARGDALKLRHLRARSAATITWRHGWDWVTVEGAVELAGPDDPLPGLAPAALPALMREVFTGCGGTHDDWPAFDRTIAAERRCAVLVTPTRIYGNPA